MMKFVKGLAFLLLAVFIGCNGKPSETELKVFKGRLIIGHEVSEFRPCNDTLSYWITDESSKLDSLYRQITYDAKEPYQEVYCEIKAITSSSKEGFPSTYDGSLSVKEIIKIEKIDLEKNCK